ncbi:hypothetical protein IID22_04760 [Patescibacteria group bacterium]|nr:hypothetical protein [Patescibacteria group bacterium]
MYIGLKDIGVTLKAPGDITITSISSSENKERRSTDYSLEFSLCKDVHGYFIHIKTLTPELRDLLTEDNCELYGEGNKYKNCWAGVQKELKAGDIIGTVGNNQQRNFDFGTYDLRVTNDFANPDRYRSRSPNIVCAFDYYTAALKDAFYAKLERSKDPICGQINYDVAGTLQGNWFITAFKKTPDFQSGDELNADMSSSFRGNPAFQSGEDVIGDTTPDMPEGWNKILSFAKSNFDPDIAVISIGGVFTQASTYSFTPKNDGFINRAFDEVKPGGNIYCYESDPDAYSEKKSTSGKILVKLTSTTELSIEHQSGTCSGSYSFTGPTIYER